MKKNNKKGFTIVELVIVIAVIAILSAVLIPTFGSLITDANHSAAQQKARNAYTSYIQAHSQESGKLNANLVIEADGFYFTITGGQLAPVEAGDDGEVTVPAHHKAVETLNGAKVYLAGSCVDGNDDGTLCDTCGADTATNP